MNLDGDDYLTDNSFVSNAVRLIEANPQVMLVFAKAKTLFESSGVVIEDKSNSSLPSIIEGDRLFFDYPRGHTIPHLSSLYRRDLAMEVGYYTSHTLSSDWESVLKLIQGHKVGFLNECVGVWRKHPENASRSFDLEEIAKNVDYIESPYRYALEQGRLRKADLEKWRRRMLIRYFVKHPTYYP